MATDYNELLEITKRLITIESTANNPAGLHDAYDVIVEMLRATDKDITVEHFDRDGRPSLLAYRGRQRPENFRMILNGHLDVVPGDEIQFTPVVRGSKLYGRGAYDMKAAAVVMTDVFCEYVDKVPYALGLQIVTDEEISGFHGTQYQINSGVRSDFVICGECGRNEGTYEIANEAKGIAVVEVDFAGTAAHGAYLWRGDNAILRATKFTNDILQRYPIPESEAPDNTTVNVSSISTSNTAYTKVPEHATVRLDIRFLSSDQNFRTKQHLAALIEEIDPTARISRFLAFEAPVYTSPNNPLLQQLKAAAEKVEKHEFTLVRRHATSDGRFYGNVGDQACEFGIAGVGQHSGAEYITFKAFRNYHKTLSTFLQGSIIAEAENVNTAAYQAA